MTGVRHVSLRRTPLTPDEPRIDAFEEDGLRRSSARRQDRAMLGGGLRARAH